MATIVEYAAVPWHKQHLALFKLAQTVRAALQYMQQTPVQLFAAL